MREAAIAWTLCPGLRQVVRGLMDAEAIGQALLSTLGGTIERAEHEDEARHDLVAVGLSMRAGSGVLETLRTRRVRPIIIPAHHAHVLPEWPDDLRAVLSYALRARLPFDLLAIDFDHAGLAYESASGTARLLAALVERVGSGVRITPLVRTPGAGRGEVTTMLSTLWTTDSGADVGDADEIVITPEEVRAYSSAPAPLEQAASIVIRGLTPNSIELADRVLMALQMIESVNVTIVPAPVNRQMRRNARGVVFHVPGIVEIRPTRTKRTVALGEPGARLRYRHEVIGHFKLHGENTPIGRANPDELVYVPGAGDVVQVWCPPYIQGPPGAPLRLKVWKLDGYVDHEDG